MHMPALAKVDILIAVTDLPELVVIISGLFYQ